MLQTYMEDTLDVPLKDILARVQKHICEGAKYAGILTQKCPNDFWVYQELIFELRPSVIVEVGNYRGGSALALADVQNTFGRGRVIAVDIDHSWIDPKVKDDPRIRLVTGDATSVFDQVSRLISESDTVMIIEDSSHTFENTLSVLRTYSPLVTPGSYFIVEDGICCHGLEVDFSPGPYEAIGVFLTENEAFYSDREREGFVITWNPKGYLKRKC
jgi:cephalosporin hydroxylase